MKKIVAILLFVTGPVLCAQEDDISPERGEQAYFDYACYACHGYNGTGRAPLSRDTSGILQSELAFITYLRLRAEQNPINPSYRMPNYDASTLSDATARDLYAYLVALDDNPPPIEEIPAFRQLLESAQQAQEPEDDDESVND